MRLEARWIDVFAEAFGLCGVAPGDPCAVLSETQTRPELPLLAELALLRRGARVFHLVLPARPLAAQVDAGAEQAQQGGVDVAVVAGVLRQRRVRQGAPRLDVAGRPRGEEGDDLARLRLVDQVRGALVVDRLQRVGCAHRQQAHPVAAQRRDAGAPVLQVGEEVFAQAQDDLVRHRLQVEAQRLRARCLKLRV